MDRDRLERAALAIYAGTWRGSSECSGLGGFDMTYSEAVEGGTNFLRAIDKACPERLEPDGILMNVDNTGNFTSSSMTPAWHMKYCPEVKALVLRARAVVDMSNKGQYDCMSSSGDEALQELEKHLTPFHEEPDAQEAH